LSKTLAYVLCGDGTPVRVDAEDLPLLLKYRWSKHPRRPGNCYAATGGGLLMHRLVTKAPRGTLVDHWNTNGLDNRKSNLRYCDHQQNGGNMRNRPHGTPYKGVHWHPKASKRNPFMAQITVNRRRKYLGLFPDAESAAAAYDQAALEHFGEFARINFPVRMT
jgi:hypothetical protein